MAFEPIGSHAYGCALLDSPNGMSDVRLDGLKQIAETYRCRQ